MRSSSFQPALVRRASKKYARRTQMRWPKMTIEGSGKPIGFIRWGYVKKTAFESLRKGVAVTTLLAMAVSSSWAQEIDSTVLQEETARKAQESAPAPSTQSVPTAPAQPTPPQPPSGQASSSQASSQTSTPRHNSPIRSLYCPQGRSCRWGCCGHCKSNQAETFICKLRFR